MKKEEEKKKKKADRKRQNKRKRNAPLRVASIGFFRFSSEVSACQYGIESQFISSYIAIAVRQQCCPCSQRAQSQPANSQDRSPACLFLLVYFFFLLSSPMSFLSISLFTVGN